MTRPVAACEKIASDLAFELGLPVPPVTLFDRANAATGEARYHSVSAPPFDDVSTWGDVKADPDLLRVARGCALGPMSAMIVFDTWLDGGDHVDHPGNLLVTIPGASSPPTASFAWIDYGYSLTHTWIAQGYKNEQVVPIYDPTLTADFAIMRETIDAIEAVSDATIERIVSRIADAFLSKPHKTLIVEGLQYRRNNLRRIIAARHPGVQ